MKTIAVLLISVAVSGQMLKRFEIHRPYGSVTGKLVAYMRDREVNLSTDALRAWEGWHPEIIVFTELLPDGREQLRAFNSITGVRSDITTERLSIRDISTVLLDNGESVLVLFMRDNSGRTPWLGLAHPKLGVFQRIPNATAGAIVKDTVVVHFFDGREVDANVQDLQRVRPSRTEAISLRPPSTIRR